MARQITFGWRVPDFPEARFASGKQKAAQFREQIFNYTAALQDGGLDSIWVGDHFFPFPDQVNQAEDTIEAWTTLTYLMARFPRLRGGTIVLSQGYRPPALLAKMAADLQWLSGGRFILGIGAGWKENEYRAYGYDFPPAGVRLAQLEEAAQVIRKMWTEDAPTFHGAYYHVEKAYCSPRPVPIPPLLIGGDGPKRTLRIVAQYGDWCNLNNASLDHCRERLAVLNRHCQDVGRNYDDIVKTFACDAVSVARTHAEAERLRRSSFTRELPGFIGAPGEVRDQIQQYVDLGFTHFILRFEDFPNTSSADLFMREVMPHFL